MLSPDQQVISGHLAPQTGTSSAGLRQRLMAMAHRSRELYRSRRAETGLINHRLQNNRHLLAQYLGGNWIDRHCLLLERRLNMRHRHGAVVLQQILSLRAGLLADRLQDLDPEQLVFIDTETCQLSNGDAMAFVIGVARFIDEQLVIRQYLLSDYQGEAAMLQAVADFIPSRPVLVSYNGKSFDLPLLNARYHQASLASPFKLDGHLDLLHFTRRAFSHRWRDCSLKAAERALLAFNRVDDMPGSQAPAIWRELLHRGDWRRVPALLQHHYHDVLSLPALLLRLSQVYAEPDLFGADSHAIARFYLRQKRDDLAEDHLRSREYRRDRQRLLDLARLYKKQKRWTEASGIWQELADQHDCPESVENLSKYYEHIAKDYARAMTFARRLDQAGNGHRCHRLRRKAAGSQADLMAA